MAGRTDDAKRARIRAFVLANRDLSLKQLERSLGITAATIRSEARIMLAAGLIDRLPEGDSGRYMTARGGFTLTPKGDVLRDGMFVAEFDAGSHQDCPAEYVADRRRAITGRAE